MIKYIRNKTNKKFKDQLKDIEYKIRKNHIDLGEN